MARVDQETKHLQHPTEPETWVDVRVPIRAGDLENLSGAPSAVTIQYELIAAAIQGWSYDYPPSLHALREQDVETINWLRREVLEYSGVRDDETKKNSNGSSLPGQPAPEESPSSSDDL